MLLNCSHLVSFMCRVCSVTAADSFAVCAIEGISKLKMLFCLPGALWGKHTHLRGVHILQCKDVHITSDRPLPVHKDGESGGIQREFSVTIEKKPLKIIMPVL